MFPFRPQRQPITQHLTIGSVKDQTEPATQHQHRPRRHGHRGSKLAWGHHCCWHHHERKTPRLDQSMQVPRPILRARPAGNLAEQCRMACSQASTNPMSQLKSGTQHPWIFSWKQAHAAKISSLLPSGSRKPLVRRAAETQLLQASREARN